MRAPIVTTAPTVALFPSAQPPTAQVSDTSAQVLDDYIYKNPAFDAQYWRAIGSIAGRAPAVATKVEAMRDHARAWESRMDIVQNAKDNILCASYFIQPDGHGIAFMDELIKAAKRGVKVGLVFDTMAMPYTHKFSTKEQIKTLERQMAELVGLGGYVTYFGGLREQAKLPGSGMHFKALVADGTVAQTGGRNIGGHYYGELFNDFEMRFEGPVAKALADDCMEMLSHGDPTRVFRSAKKMQELAFNEYRRDMGYRLTSAVQPSGTPAGLYHVVTWDVIHQRANRKDENRCALALLETIKRAKRDITLTSNYATGNKLLREAIIDAAKRGVNVRIISTGESASHYSKAAFHMSQPAFKELIDAGVRVYETVKVPDHAKIYVIDDVAAFGTYNFADYGDSRLVDSLVFTGEPRDVQIMRGILDNSIAACTLVNPAQKPPAPKGRFMRLVAKVAWGIRS